MMSHSTSESVGPDHPTWKTFIASLFTSPFWIDPSKRDSVGSHWIAMMVPYGIDLSSYTSVKPYAVTIYYHLLSRSMPLTSDQAQFWPQRALDSFKLWVNEGMREDENQPIVPSQTIPDTVRPIETPLKLRRDILAMTDIELNEYRARLDDVLHAKELGSDSVWQWLCLGNYTP
jgi:hypothetical protein